MPSSNIYNADTIATMIMYALIIYSLDLYNRVVQLELTWVIENSNKGLGKMPSTPFLSTVAEDNKRCLLCYKRFQSNDDASSVTISGLISLQILADRWLDVDVFTPPIR